MDKLLTVREVAERLRAGMSTIEHLIARREMPVVRIGRRTLVSEADLEQWINDRKEVRDGQG